MNKKNKIDSLLDDKEKTPVFMSKLSKVALYGDSLYLAHSKHYNNSKHFVCVRFNKPISKIV